MKIHSALNVSVSRFLYNRYLPSSSLSSTSAGTSARRHRDVGERRDGRRSTRRSPPVIYIVITVISSIYIIMNMILTIMIMIDHRYDHHDHDHHVDHHRHHHCYLVFSSSISIIINIIMRGTKVLC